MAVDTARTASTGEEVTRLAGSSGAATDAGMRAAAASDEVGALVGVTIAAVHSRPAGMAGVPRSKLAGSSVREATMATTGDSAVTAAQLVGKAPATLLL